MHRSALVAFLLVVATVTTATAQTKDPLPRFVVDAQGLFGGMPTTDGWVPAVPADTPIPGHGLGIGGGVHVYLLKLGLATFGIGGSAVMVRKAGSPLMTTAGVATTPAVTTSVTSVNPQISINFGHRLGWSYLSAGYSSAKVKSSSTAFTTPPPTTPPTTTPPTTTPPTTTPPPTTPANTIPAATAPEMWNPGFNYGGGARWFMKPHLAASFDVRFVQLSSRAATAQNPVFALRSKMVNFMVGISIQ
jgi:opacity protein-like surface antigen